MCRRNSIACSSILKVPSIVYNGSIWVTATSGNRSSPPVWSYSLSPNVPPWLSAGRRPPTPATMGPFDLLCAAAPRRRLAATFEPVAGCHRWSTFLQARQLTGRGSTQSYPTWVSGLSEYSRFRRRMGKSPRNAATPPQFYIIIINAFSLVVKYCHTICRVNIVLLILLRMLFSTLKYTCTALAAGLA